MHLGNTETRYGALSQALHWATVICVVAGWLLGQFMDDFPKGIARDSALATHIALGEFVLVLLAGDATQRSFHDSPLIQGHTYAYALFARDDCGNWSVAGQPYVFTPAKTMISPR